MRRILFLLAVVCLLAAPALAQDPVKVDAKHYKVLMENDKVRVLRVTYAPKEKSVMHDHPDTLAIFLADSRVSFATPDGKSEVRTAKKGDVQWSAATKHNPENLSDKPLEVILVEFKAPKAK
ncbi:MAG TPA: cytoplasmic protein [Candidatus Xenobia bacterium]|nr:cytoplasmic protein [Candidatus Xenobia bacterium]